MGVCVVIGWGMTPRKPSSISFQSFQTPAQVRFDLGTVEVDDPEEVALEIEARARATGLSVKVTPGRRP